VTNCVIHARTSLTIAVVCTGDVVRVSVTDQSLALPRQRNYAPDSTTGRGMRLVDTLTTSWGVERHAGGKTMWFEVPAAGSADTDFTAWDEEVDVDLLLAAFDEPADAASPASTSGDQLPVHPPPADA
jgi:hypothetical protein